MNDLDDLIRDTLSEHASQVTSVDLTAGVSRRIRRSARVRTAVGRVAAGVAVVVGVGAVLWGASAREGSSSYLAGASGRESLVSGGECAGLTVVMGAANPGDGARHPLHPTPVRPGVDNTASMPRIGYLWLEAAGPCLDRLLLDAPGPVVRGDGDNLNPFVVNGSVSQAVIFTNESTDGVGEFSIRLNASCAGRPCPPLATVRVTVAGAPTGSVNEVATASPTP